MFLSFYGLNEQPFGVTPDPRFLYLSPSHREAIASLYLAIENGRGFSALIAKPGMGKTSIIFHLLEKLKSRTRTAFLFQPDCDSRQFFQSLMLDLGLEVSDDPVRMREFLNRLLIEEKEAGRRFVIVMDEAQNLSADVLESIRLLSNFETPTEKLLHIVLAGQPQLAATLGRTDMIQLNQRVSAAIQLQPFSVAETRAYIRHRLHIAGRVGTDIFTEEAYSVIANLSEGIPRNISSICFQALSIGCAVRSPRIHPGILSEVMSDLRRSNARIPEPPASYGKPVTEESWNIPGLPDISTIPLPVFSEKRRRPWKLGLAMGGVVALPLFAWLVVDSRWKAIMPESTPKPEISQPAAENPPLPPSAGSDPAAKDSLSKPSDVAASMDAATKPGGEVPSSGAANSTGVEEFSEPLVKPSTPRVKRTESRNLSEPRTSAKHSTGPRVVYTDKSETLFQVALENYGKSNWTLVSKIRRENPSLRDPYVILPKGQRVVLPDVSSIELDGKYR